MFVSVIIRTYNEAQYLERLISNILSQKVKNFSVEIIIVDSGSTDNTLSIATKYHCRITHIKKSEFTFGRSLNIGCQFAKGDYFVFVSGHCIPVNEDWLTELIKPFDNENICYVYGRQEGKETTKFSEYRHFDKHFPIYSKIPQNGFFCNNANAAIAKKAWQQFKFNEDLTGLEDMFLAKQIVEQGKQLAYIASASVYHIHNEKWAQIKVRYEREAFALQKIMPELHYTFFDFIKFYLSSIFHDISSAIRKKSFWKNIPDILLFRLMQHWGTFKGNHAHRKLSLQRKMHYFYPKDLDKKNYE